MRRARSTCRLRCRRHRGSAAIGSCLPESVVQAGLNPCCLTSRSRFVRRRGQSSWSRLRCCCWGSHCHLSSSIFPCCANGFALAGVSLLHPRAIRCRPHRTSYCLRGFGEIGEIPVGWFVPVGVELMLAAWLVLSPTRMVLVGLGSRGSCRSGHGDHLALRCDRSEPHDLRCRPCCLTCA